MKDFLTLQVVDADDGDQPVVTADDDGVSRQKPEAVDAGVELGVTQDLTHAQVDDADDAVLAADDQEFVLRVDFVFVD